VDELTQSGAEVRVLDSLLHGSQPLLPYALKPEFEFIRGDVRDADIVRTALDGVSDVVHLAAIVGDRACDNDTQLATEVNLEATCQLAALALEHGVRQLTFASTCSNYGLVNSSERADEETQLKPLSHYADTKVAAEHEVGKFAERGLAVRVLRFATVFGLSPRMRFDLLVNDFVRAAALTRKIEIYHSESWRPYLHVRDVAKAISSCLSDRLPGNAHPIILNVGDDGLNYQKTDVATQVADEIPDTQIVEGSDGHDTRSYRVSFKAIRERLGFAATRTLQDGIDEVRRLLRDGVLVDPWSPELENH
jgi:nucleoside-diphosphate-sugar epimerase